MKMQDLNLITFSVLASVESPTKHTYAHVNPLLFRLLSIAPEDWEWDEDRFVTGSSFHSIFYENMVFVTATEEMFIAAHGKSARIEGSHGPPELVTKYIETLAENTFRRAEIHWNFQVQLEDSNSWLAGRFFCPEMPSKKWRKIELIPTITLDTEGALNTFKFSPNTENSLLDINCKSGPILFADDNDLIRWISGYRELESEILINLTSIMGLEND